MFAFLGEHLFYHETDTLIQTAICIEKPNIYLINADKFNHEILHGLMFFGLRDVLANIQKTDFYRISRSLQTLYWQSCHQFCSRCGEKTQFHHFEQTGQLLANCPACHYHQYPRINPCTITAITRKYQDKTQILLAHHQRAKTTQVYSLIAGFVEIGETLEDCVKREVLEEIGVQVDNIRYIASQPWAFPSNLMIGFIAEYVAGEVVIDKDELIDARFFDLDNLPKTPEKGTIAHDLINFVKDTASVQEA